MTLRIRPLFFAVLSLSACGGSNETPTGQRAGDPANNSSGAGGTSAVAGAGGGEQGGLGGVGGAAGVQTGGMNPGGSAQAGVGGNSCAGTICGDSCVDLSSSKEHCGQCFSACEGDCKDATCQKWKKVQINYDYGCLLSVKNSLYCWGKNTYGEVGTGDQNPVLYPQKIMDDVEDFSSYGSHVCALTKLKDVFCWGLNHHGELGTGTIGIETIPQKVSLKNVRSISTSDFSSCAVTEKNNLYCWGKSPGIFKPFSYDIVKSPKLVEVGVEQCFPGFNFIFVKNTDQTFSCWGSNGGGELGLGAEQNGYEEKKYFQFPGKVKALKVSSSSACVLFEDGSISCTGSNVYGQLGTPITDKQVSFQPAEVPAMSDLECGGGSCCGIQEGDVYCWGYKNYIIPDHSELSSPVAEKVLNLPKVSSLSLGSNAACALGLDHHVYCWGRNWDGVLNGSLKSEIMPITKMPF
jgi:alpha-tubulin suppressor-like RCC1 family protein